MLPKLSFVNFSVGEFSYVYKAHMLKPLVIMHQSNVRELDTSLNLSQSFQPATVAVKTLKGKLQITQNGNYMTCGTIISLIWYADF